MRAPCRDESESRIVARCAQLYAAVGGKVYWLSQYRPARQSPGLPDLLIVFQGRALILHEGKTPTGRLSEEQAELRQLVAGIPGVRQVTGGFDEAWGALQDLGYVVRGAVPLAQSE